MAGGPLVSPGLCSTFPAPCLGLGQACAGGVCAHRVGVCHGAVLWCQAMLQGLHWVQTALVQLRVPHTGAVQCEVPPRPPALWFPGAPWH